MKDKDWSFTTGGDVAAIDVVFIAHHRADAPDTPRLIGPFRCEVDLEPTNPGDICLFDVKMELSERIKLVKGQGD